MVQNSGKRDSGSEAEKRRTCIEFQNKLAKRIGNDRLPAKYRVDVVLGYSLKSSHSKVDMLPWN